MHRLLPGGMKIGLGVVAVVTLLAFTMPLPAVDYRTDRTIPKRLSSAYNNSGLLRFRRRWAPDDSGDRRHSAKLLILGYYRPGSTLTGEILSHLNNSFYVFEPLHTMEYFLLKNKAPLIFLNGTRGSRLLPGYELPYAISVIKSFLLCEMDNIDRSTLTGEFGPMFTKQLAEFVKCRDAAARDGVITSQMCLKQLKDSCKAAPVRVIKTIRLSMKTVSNILKSVPDLKVIHLIRDPRGMLYSEWFASSTPYSFLQQSICNTLKIDLEIRKDLEKKYPNTFMEVIYEDLAQNPDDMLERIYRFSGLDLPSHVREWLKLSTSSRITGKGKLNTTRSNSTETAYQWTKHLSWSMVNYFQRSCDQVLRHGNFPIIDSLSSLDNFVIPKRETA